MIRSHCHIGAALEFMQEEYNFMVTENWYSHKGKKIAWKWGGEDPLELQIPNRQNHGTLQAGFIVVLYKTQQKW